MLEAGPGLFQLQTGEIQRLDSYIPYIDRNAQDRLCDLMNVHEQVLMHGVSDWIQHLYYCEVMLLQNGQGQSYDADAWLAHSFIGNGQHLYINQPNIQIQVRVQQEFRRDRGCQYIRDQIIADISALPTSVQPNRAQLRRAARGELLVIRRQLLNTAFIDMT